MSVPLAVVALAVGLGLLTVAADVFVVAAEGVALRLRWSPAVIGAVVVGFGTSLPELVTSADAALAGEADLALGNAAGSNVANLLLILGIAALVAPVEAGGRGPGRDVALAAGAGWLLVALAANGSLGIVDAVLLLVALAAIVTWQIALGRDQPLEVAGTGALGGLTVRVVGGLIGVIVGARLLVWGATTVAAELGVPAIVIGSVLVAVGTSLPELATGIASARRRQTALLLGNLIGSNTFNALAVVGVAGAIGAATGEGLTVDAPALIVIVTAAAVTSVIGARLWRTPRLGRLGAALLVTVYVASVPLLVAVSTG